VTLLSAVPTKPRRPTVALAAAIGFGLLAAFFAWQAAEPLWLAAGHGTPGTATVTRCDGSGVAPSDSPGATYQCVRFDAADGSFTAVDVTLRGAGAAARTEGTTLPARMLAPDRQQAYAASPAGLHLRWSLGLLMTLACGAAIGWGTGATRFREPTSRRLAVLLSFAGPVLLATGFAIAAR